MDGAQKLCRTRSDGKRTGSGRYRNFRKEVSLWESGKGSRLLDFGIADSGPSGGEILPILNCASLQRALHRKK